MSFPEDAYKNPHAGLGDAELADTDGDGVGEISAGYLGLVGVKSISLDGKIRWSDRSLANVFSLAVGGPDQSGHRPLYCVNDRAALVALDSRGKVERQLSLDGRLLFGIAAENLDENPQPELCGLSSPNLGENLAVGLDPQGNLLWSYQMPKGTFAETTERIHGVRLAKNWSGPMDPLGSGRISACRGHRRQARRPVQLRRRRQQHGRNQSRRAGRFAVRIPQRGRSRGRGIAVMYPD